MKTDGYTRGASTQRQRISRRLAGSYSLLVLLLLFFLTAFTLPVHATNLNNDTTPSKATERTLIVGSEQNFPPLSTGMTDEEAGGFTVELWRAVAAEAGLQYTIRVLPFGQLLDEFKAGRIDVLINIAQSEERRQFADFTVPHEIVHGAMFVRKGETSINNEADLANKSVIVVRGDLAHDYAIKLGLSSQLVLVDTAADAMRMLSSGKGDVVLLSKLVGMLTLQELGIKNIDALQAKLGVVQKFSFAVQRGQRPLLDRINEAMVITSAQGTYGKLHEKWFGVYEDHNTDSSKLLLSVLPIALLFLAAWGYTYYKSRNERLATENKLRTLYAAIEQSPISVVITSIEANIEYVNPRFSAVTGYSKEEVVGHNPRILQSGLTPKATYEELWKKLTNDQAWQGELINKRKNGEIYWEDAHIAPVKQPSGEITHFVAAKIDISERKRIEKVNKQSEDRLHFILENSPIAVRITSLRTHAVMYANQSYIELIGMTPGAAIGIDPRTYYTQPQDYEDVLEQLSQGYRITNRLMELSIPSQGNMTKWALASYLQLEYNGEAAVLGWFYDITDRKAMEEQVQRLAQCDPLTDLPNRRLFSDRLQQALAFAIRDRTRLAVMFLDLDRFKPINDKYGHAMGDLVLKEVATRIQSSLRASDTLARIGGDEFVVLLPHVSSVSDVVGVAEKVRQVLNQPFIVDEHVMSLSSSAGIALYPEHGDTEQALVRNADTAMYYAKEDGRNNVQVYQPKMNARETVSPLSHPDLPSV